MGSDGEDGSSVPRTAADSIRLRSRRYNWRFATYAILVPSGEIATTCRFTAEKDCPSASGNENRVTLLDGAGAGFSRQAPAAARTARPRAATPQIQCVRRERDRD